MLAGSTYLSSMEVILLVASISEKYLAKPIHERTYYLLVKNPFQIYFDNQVFRIALSGFLVHFLVYVLLGPVMILLARAMAKDAELEAAVRWRFRYL